MKISSETLGILKNFATINPSIVVKPGNKIGSLSIMKNILADAEVQETFPTEFAIYGLNEFLGAISLFNDPDFEFHDKWVVISGEKNRVRYFYCDASLIATPNKKITMPKAEVAFELPKGDLDRLMKAASVLGAPDLSLVSDGETEVLRVMDRKNDTGNSYDLEISKTPAAAYSMDFKVENLKMIPGDYDVLVSKSLISRFTNKSMNLVYHIALENTSNYNVD